LIEGTQQETTVSIGNRRLKSATRGCDGPIDGRQSKGGRGRGGGRRRRNKSDDPIQMMGNKKG
jgi:hypothetical protein